MNDLPRPPSRIDGKMNPEYRRWYRLTNPEPQKKYSRSEKAKACQKRHYESKMGIARAEARREAGVPSRSQTKCVECGLVYDRTEARNHGAKIFRGRGYRCICGQCR